MRRAGFLLVVLSVASVPVGCSEDEDAPLAPEPPDYGEGGGRDATIDVVPLPEASRPNPADSRCERLGFVCQPAETHAKIEWPPCGYQPSLPLTPRTAYPYSCKDSAGGDSDLVCCERLADGGIADAADDG